MTAGKKALREAARLEAARVYGQVQREHCSQTVDGAVYDTREPVHRRESRPMKANHGQHQLREGA